MSSCSSEQASLICCAGYCYSTLILGFVQFVLHSGSLPRWPLCILDPFQFVCLKLGDVRFGRWSIQFCNVRPRTEYTQLERALDDLVFCWVEWARGYVYYRIMYFGSPGPVYIKQYSSSSRSILQQYIFSRQIVFWIQIYLV